MIPSQDSYIAYTHRFFNTWVQVYDFFALLITPVYNQTVRSLGDISDKIVLDVCTGTGEIALRLEKQGALVTAVDITPSMLSRARKKAATSSINFEQADARSLRFSDKSFDISVLSLGLHDMPRPVRIAVLRELARVTKEKIVISEYYFPNNSLYQRILRKIISLFETSYFVRFAEEGILPIIQESKIGTPLIRPIRFFCFAIYEIDLTKTNEPLRN